MRFHERFAAAAAAPDAAAAAADNEAARAGDGGWRFAELVRRGLAAGGPAITRRDPSERTLNSSDGRMRPCARSVETGAQCRARPGPGGAAGRGRVPVRAARGG